MATRDPLRLTLERRADGVRWRRVFRGRTWVSKLYAKPRKRNEGEALRQFQEWRKLWIWKDHFIDFIQQQPVSAEAKNVLLEIVKSNDSGPSKRIAMAIHGIADRRRGILLRAIFQRRPWDEFLDPVVMQFERDVMEWLTDNAEPGAKVEIEPLAMIDIEGFTRLRDDFFGLPGSWRHQLQNDFEGVRQENTQTKPDDVRIGKTEKVMPQFSTRLNSYRTTGQGAIEHDLLRVADGSLTLRDVCLSRYGNP